MNIASEQLTGVTIDVCQMMLGLDVTPSTDEQANNPVTVAATISISGERNAIIEVATCSAAARSLTSVMFATDADCVLEEEISDAVAEIVNMIGGNIKGMLGGECNLSIPCISNGPLLPPSEHAEKVSFALGGGVMHVSCSILENSNSPV